MATVKPILGDGKRNLLACAVNLSTTGEPRYVVIGHRIEQADLEFNIELVEGIDILGETWARAESKKLTQSFSGLEVTEGPRGELAALLNHYVMNDELDKLTEFKAVLIYGMYETTAPYTAVEYDGCSIIPNGILGSKFLTTDITITFGGSEKKGTASALKGEITFTETPSA